jgi:hypothetical protein
MTDKNGIEKESEAKVCKECYLGMNFVACERKALERDAEAEARITVGFLTSIDRVGHTMVAESQLGVILSCFPVVGGGDGFILITVDELLVRLTEQGGSWSARREIPLKRCWECKCVARPGDTVCGCQVHTHVLSREVTAIP